MTLTLAFRDLSTSYYGKEFKEEMTLGKIGKTLMALLWTVLILGFMGVGTIVMCFVLLFG